MIQRGTAVFPRGLRRRPVFAHIAAPVALQTSKSTLTSCHHVAVKESELSVHQIERERRHAAALRLGLVTRNAEKQGESSRISRDFFHPPNRRIATSARVTSENRRTRHAVISVTRGFRPSPRRTRARVSPTLSKPWISPDPGWRNTVMHVPKAVIKLLVFFLSVPSSTRLRADRTSPLFPFPNRRSRPRHVRHRVLHDGG